MDCDPIVHGVAKSLTRLSDCSHFTIMLKWRHLRLNNLKMQLIFVFIFLDI